MPFCPHRKHIISEGDSKQQFVDFHQINPCFLPPCIDVPIAIELDQVVVSSMSWQCRPSFALGVYFKSDLSIHLYKMT